MAQLVFENNASALLAASVDDQDTTIQVAVGFGALFPNPGAGQYFVVVLRDATGAYEVCHCTGRSGDLLTVERAKEGTAAQHWVNNQTRVECRATKGTFEAFIQRTGDVMSGDLDMDGHQLIDAEVIGNDTVISGGQIVGVPIRGALNDDSNEIFVPPDGSTPTIGGTPILTAANGAQALPVGSIIMWFGSPNNIPNGWALCDGSNGTPDMRGLMPIGAGNGIALGQEVGSATASTSSSGSHSHGGSSGSTSLTTAQLPSHSHRLLGATGSGVTDTVVNSPSAVGVGASRNASSGPYAATTNAGTPFVEGTGSGQGHSHSISSDGAHTHTVSLQPPARGLYFIMRVS
jgi:microcystin-dependent protein